MDRIKPQSSGTPALLRMIPRPVGPGTSFPSAPLRQARRGRPPPAYGSPGPDAASGGCRTGSTLAAVNGAEKLGHWGRVILDTYIIHGIRVEGAIVHPTPTCPPAGWSSGWPPGAWPVPAGSLPSTAPPECTPAAARSGCVDGQGNGPSLRAIAWLGTERSLSD